MKRDNLSEVMKWVFIIGSIGGFVVWACLFLSDINGLQRRIFFYDTNDWFMDFYNTVYYAVGKTPYSWGWLPARNYLPLSYMILYPFTFLFQYDVEDWGTSYAARYSQLSAVAGAVFLVVSFGVLFYFLYKKIEGKEFEKIMTIVALFCSSVVIYNFDRANEQILVTGLLFGYFILYKKDSIYLRHLAYILLAISAAMKLFPAIFGVLLIYEKKYKDALLAIGYGLAFAILPFFWLEGGFGENFFLFLNALKLHAQAYTGGSLGWNAQTIFNVSYNFLILPYVALVFALLLANKLKCEWKKNLLLTLSVIMTSGQQGFYCLLFLFFAIVLFLNDTHQKCDWWYLIGFLIILSPIQYELSNVALLINNDTLINSICIIMYVALFVEGFIVAIKSERKDKEKVVLQKKTS